MAAGETTATQEMNLAARLDQLEAAIMEAHNTVDRVVPRPGEEGKEPHGEGAISCLNRCQNRMAELNSRLGGLASSVGQL